MGLHSLARTLSNPRTNDTEPPRQAEQGAGGNAALRHRCKVQSLDYYSCGGCVGAASLSLSVKPHSHTTMHSRLYSALCLAAILIAAGCERAPSKAQVVGTYAGLLSGATESLVLRADGTFTQTVSLPSGQKVTGAGTWSLKYKAVTLDRYMHFYDEEKRGALVQPTEVFGLIYRWGADMLIRDWDSGYHTLKKT